MFACILINFNISVKLGYPQQPVRVDCESVNRPLRLPHASDLQPRFSILVSPRRARDLAALEISSGARSRRHNGAQLRAIASSSARGKLISMQAIRRGRRRLTKQQTRICHGREKTCSELSDSTARIATMK